MQTIFKTIEQLIEDNSSPLPLETIPNTMGINLNSVHGISWMIQDDGQLVNLAIYFKPSPTIDENQQLQIIS